MAAGGGGGGGGGGSGAPLCKKVQFEPVRLGAVSSLEEMDMRVLQFQNKKLSQVLERPSFTLGSRLPWFFFIQYQAKVVQFQKV